jgi:hypothetical protein
VPTHRKQNQHKFKSSEITLIDKILQECQQKR